MTPLAHQLTRKAWDLRISAEIRARLREILSEIHCFEVSQVVGLVSLLLEKTRTSEHQQAILGNIEEKCFLPAPRTWIEMRIDGGRVAFLCEEDHDGKITIWLFRTGQDDPSKCGFIGQIRPDGHLPDTASCVDLNELTRVKSIIFVMIALSLINTPRIVGRKQHSVHRGLARDILRSRKLVGKFPLHAWTEILLDVSIPTKIENGTHEAHLTGEKCLHFCRAHLRFLASGELTIVKSHWRGNAALGIKQSRYIVEGSPRKSAIEHHPG